MDKAIELAEQCLKNAPLALKWTKYLVHAADQMSEEDAMKYCDAAYRFLEKPKTVLKDQQHSQKSVSQFGRVAKSRIFHLQV